MPVIAGNFNNITVFSFVQNVIDFTGLENTVTLKINDLANDLLEAFTFTGGKNVLDEDFGNVGHYPDVFYRGVRLVTGGTGSGSFTLSHTSTTLTTGGTYNTVTQTGGSATITLGSGHDTVNLDAAPFSQVPGAAFTGEYAVHLAGTNNVINAFASKLTEDGGSGSSTFNFNYDLYNDQLSLGGGNPASSYAVATWGLYNTFNLLDIDNNSITTGSGGAKVSIAWPAICTPSSL